MVEENVERENQSTSLSLVPAFEQFYLITHCSEVLYLKDMFINDYLTNSGYH
jgi:hypothetical protein